MCIHEVSLELIHGASLLIADLTGELTFSLNLDPGSAWTATVSSVMGEETHTLKLLVTHHAFDQVGLTIELRLSVPLGDFSGKLLCWNVPGHGLILASHLADLFVDPFPLLSQLLHGVMVPWPAGIIQCSLFITS